MSHEDRVLAVWSPDWPVTAAARAAGVPAHRPAAVFHANRVLACSATARRAGVRRGLRRREAQARCPELAVLAPDPDRDARAFEPVVVAVEELAPGVEVIRPGLLVLPARGPVGWFGGERSAAERLIDQVALHTRAECQIGFADGTFAAVLAARRGRGVEPGRTREFLAPLEVAELDRDPDVDRSELVDLLRRLGLRSLGAFASLPAADVASRFGADAVLAHRLARGLDPRPPVRRVPPEELAAELELDPPVDRVDAAAFAARGLAMELHRTLAGHGLACTRLGVHARTESGEELLRIWRCAEPLTPGGTVDRVRWQLDSWLARGGSGALVALRLTPEDTVTAGALQRGLWGDVGEADERAGRALVRAQALLGPEAVLTPVLTGGRDPSERVRLVPWGEDRAPDPAEELRAVAPDPVHLPFDDGAGPGSGAAGVSPPTSPTGRSPAVGRGSTPGRTRLGAAPERPAPVDLDAAPSRPGAVASTSRPGEVPSETGPPDARPPDARPPDARPPDARPPGPLSGRARTSSPVRSRPPRDPPPAWPGRLPTPSPATVPPEPIPVQLLDTDGAKVRPIAPDLLGSAPVHLADGGRPPREIRDWAGPWPVGRRWWAAGKDPGAEGPGITVRVQVVLADGAALLLIHRGQGWWVTGVYD